MVVEWFDEAQQHWIEQLEYCAKTFGESTASELIKRADEKIDRLCKFPTSGTLEPLLKDDGSDSRYVLVQRRIKLILVLHNSNCFLRIFRFEDGVASY